MGDKLWKSTERRIAHLLGGVRISINGRQGPDVVTAWLQVEVKERRELPGWLAQASEQAQAGRCATRLPVVALHQAGDDYANALLCVRLRDWVEWGGPGGPGGPGGQDDQAQG